MAETANVTFTIDANLKKEAEALFDDFGLDMTTAYVVFLKQSVRKQKLPFELSRDIPNTETLEALEEANEILKNPSAYRGYTDIEQMTRELLAEC
jgi:DNA-damage-inducible protein J